MGLILVFAVGGFLLGFFASAAAREARKRMIGPPYVFTFDALPGAATVGLPPGKTVDASTVCPYCKQPALATVNRETIWIDCRNCGTVRGYAIEPGVGEYAIQVPKVDV